MSARPDANARDRAQENPPESAALGKRLRPCHYQDLFVRHDGEVYPCCLTKDHPHLRIGNIRDPDFASKLAGYDLGRCECPEWTYNSVFRKALPEDRVDIAMLNVELPLTCNSSCAMCCVHSPQYTREHPRPDTSTFPGILRLFERFKPRGAYFQGGEVLVQPAALPLMEDIRRVSPGTALSLVTNGNVPLPVMERAEKIFDSFCVGLYGFQTHTYKTITGLNLERVKRVCAWLVEKNRDKVCLKYLTTPISFHEAPLFLQWAIDLGPRSVMLVDADSHDYVRYTKPPEGLRFSDAQPPLHDLYWERVFSRTFKRIEAVLAANARRMEEKGISVTRCGGLFSRP